MSADVHNQGGRRTSKTEAAPDVQPMNRRDRERFRRRHWNVSVIVLALVGSLTLAVSPAYSGPPSSGKGSDARNEALAKRADQQGPLLLVVQIQHPGRGREVADDARRNGGSNIRTFSHMPYVALKGTGNTVRALDRNPHVVAIWEDVPEPPALNSSLPVINADDTRGLGWTGDGATVAILDTGIDADHPFFADNNGGNPATSRIVSQACFSDRNNSGTDQQFSLCTNGTTTDLTSANVDGHAQCDAAVSN